jgi:glycerophosphoryl diester phosphodiesterase
MTLVIAHRGASVAERENTIAAFRAARRLGADMVELDVRRTADGALAVHHDARIDGTPLVSLASTELPPYVPLLADALDACEGMGVNVEIKNSPLDPDFDPDRRLATAVVELVAARGECGRVLVSSFDPVTIERVRTADPRIATAWLTYGVEAAVAIGTCTAGGHRFWHPYERDLSPEAVAAAHTAGLGVNTWTVDDPGRMRELVAWGVDGLCTNVPDVAVAVLGRPPPPAFPGAST